MLPTRRHLLRAALFRPAIQTIHAARQEFWETKVPAAWSNEEKQLLLGQSPWARDGVARFKVERKRGRAASEMSVARPGGDVPGARPGVSPGGVASVPMGEPVPRAPSAETGPPVEFRVLARWESAQPVRLAGGPPLPEETSRFYVIRLRGMPLMPPRKPRDGEAAPNPNQGMLEAIKQGSRLERKDKNPIACAHLLTGSGESATELLLFFPRGADPITLRDKVVTLESGFGPFHLSIRFPLKEMMYKGELAL